jgi:hypothetical protein
MYGLTTVITTSDRYNGKLVMAPQADRENARYMPLTFANVEEKLERCRILLRRSYALWNQVSVKGSFEAGRQSSSP